MVVGGRAKAVIYLYSLRHLSLFVRRGAFDLDTQSSLADKQLASDGNGSQL
jgi:hypothetical protein